MTSNTFDRLFGGLSDCDLVAETRRVVEEAARRFPAVLELLADGSITLTTVCLLAPRLTADNHTGVLNAARHKSKREVERLVAELRPQPDVPAAVRKLPAPRQPASALVQASTEGLFVASAIPTARAHAVSWQLGPDRAGAGDP